MNTYPLDRIGLVVKSATSVANCISIIRKYNPISIADIKKAMDTAQFVFDCEYTDDSGVRKVRRCYDELVKSGATVEIYADSFPSSREFLSNLLGTYREIADETQAMIDEEVNSEDDND